MPRRTKWEIMKEKTIDAAYLRGFANCAVPMLQLPELFKAGGAAFDRYAQANDFVSAWRPVVAAMVEYADAHGIPHNSPSDTLASIMDRGMRS